MSRYFQGDCIACSVWRSLLEAGVRVVVVAPAAQIGQVKAGKHSSQQICFVVAVMCLVSFCHEGENRTRTTFSLRRCWHETVQVKAFVYIYSAFHFSIASIFHHKCLSDRRIASQNLPTHLFWHWLCWELRQTFSVTFQNQRSSHPRHAVIGQLCVASCDWPAVWRWEMRHSLTFSL